MNNTSNLNIVIADDAALLREALAGLLQRLGHKITAQVGSATELETTIDHLATKNQLPDIVITDVRMPPNMNDDGIHTAKTLRTRHPNLAVMVLSQYVAPTYATLLFAGTTQNQAGLGYLLKDRVSNVADFISSLNVVASGGVVIDPEVATRLMRYRSNALAVLTAREYEVLELMALGLSNSQIEGKLFLSRAAVSKHVANVFSKLGMGPQEDNRRVRAVLAFLTANATSSGAPSGLEVL